MLNVVFIITDNQGAWTLGCYGNEDIRTPHIDALASDGMRFSKAYCVNSVCSPSRATFLTGLVPSQHGVHSYLGGERPCSQMGEDAYCTIREFKNLPRILSDNGYTCGLSGKWHLGDSMRPQEGFSYWFTKPKGHTAEFYNSEAIWEGEVYEEQRYYTDAITSHATDFLERHHEEPFFLYVGYNGPYGLGGHMVETHWNRHTEYYSDKDLACFPREPIHPWLHNNREMMNNPVSIRGYAAAVSGVDDGVGEILAKLDELGHAEDTLVIFTADQGLCGGHHGMWGMGDHSRPIHTYEEAVHIPLIFRHPAGIPTGSVFDQMTCNYDFFPSVMDYLELGEEIAAESALPGTSYGPALRGASVSLDEVVIHEYESVRMIRTREWKYTWRNSDDPDELYDMVNDSGEKVNLADDESRSEIVQEMRGRLTEFFDQYADPQYDLWKGGSSKAGLLIR
ncbi:MAG: sulfatase-like hydrolase/transferase [Planctomycetota bacterium]|jgi:arylsulfatase A-like enzyme|nr:sulfatase-like hydrolase/transferase [Planctomycetota bacterium]MDP7129133.1 sulfatase-like hydrolase/transferase [Planctomycetota bacterium]